MARISDNIIKLMNFRIQQEELSKRIYLAMSIWLDYNGYSGAAKLWKKYSEEEQVHVDWAYQYLLDLNIMPTVPDLPSPKNTFTAGLKQICVESLQHEKEVSDQCEQLAQAAKDEDDHMTYELALRYCKEQVEELDKTQLWVDKINTFGDDMVQMRLLDQEMGEYAEG